MRWKWEAVLGEPADSLDEESAGGGRKTRIQRDLEVRGVSAEFAESLAKRLDDRVALLEPDTYEPVLDGAAVAYGLQVETDRTLSRNLRELEEMERLMKAFAGELSKLDEILEVLAAYLRRMKSGTPTPDRTLH